MTIIIFDFALHIRMYIYHPRGVFLVYFNTQIYVHHILFTEGTTDYVAAENIYGIYLYCKFSSDLVHSVYSLLICVKFQLI